MKLWSFVDSLDGVDEKERDKYEKFGDGFRREVEVEDVSGLKGALKKERDARKNFEKELEKFRDVDPVKYQELLEKHGEKATDLEKLQRRLSKIEDESNSWKSKAEQLTKDLIDTKLRSKVRKAALAAGVLPEDVEDVLVLTQGRFALGDSGSPVLVDNDGDPTGKTVEDFFDKEFKEAKPKFYKGLPGGSGSRGGTGGTGGAKTIKRSDFDAMDPIGQHKTIKDGYVVVD